MLGTGCRERKPQLESKAGNFLTPADLEGSRLRAPHIIVRIEVSKSLGYTPFIVTNARDFGVWSYTDRNTQNTTVVQDEDSNPISRLRCERLGREQ
jgi:hypothetical protein